MRLLIAFAGLACLMAAPAAAEERHLTVDGLQREAHLHRPAGAPDGPLPLVIMLHGGLGSGEQARDDYGWNALADAEGFMVAYPDGERRTWNAGGGCCGPAFENGLADVAFLDALIGVLIAEEQADPQRIYVAGISNGGAMAYRYACEGVFRVAAIGAVAGARTAPCPEPQPVSVIAIHGVQDETIPFEGGEGRRHRLVPIQWPSVAASLSPFVGANDCGPAQSVQAGAVRTARRPCAEGREIVLITVADGGHMWPGGGQRRGLLARVILDLDEPSQTLVATEALWSFFEEHAAPQR